jgi:hypothetical protein
VMLHSHVGLADDLVGRKELVSLFINQSA